MFIPTTLSLLNHVSQSSDHAVIFESTEFSSRRVTYCHWDISNPKNPTTYPSIKSPVDSSIHFNIYEDAKIENCIFMRKVMNSSIKYPSTTSRHVPAKLEDMWNGREVLLRQWCELIFQLQIDRNYHEDEGASLDSDVDPKIKRIWTIIEIVKSDYEVVPDEVVNDISKQHAPKSDDSCKYSKIQRSRSREYNRQKHRSRSRERRTENRRPRSRSRERYRR